MRDEAEVRARHDHLLRSVAREQDRGGDTYREIALLDELCWVLAHPYCVGQP